ncbi:MarP family serine protease [Humibacter ginsenosidimutans]|uniref:MarP family serine protease n=1 Tax=Humibacter ginsenosidimutans TaxID=2599293 RepID=A0A5B8M6L4_9MICO|nr:MarP family serine protease [Humibacter ginsenosidimutans]QDZ16023.1 MarP family serine protease [Humibacter ginsenosidimutans]
MELAVDIVLALAAVAAIAVGWHRGALVTALSMVGLIVGLWIGLLLAPAIVDLLFPNAHGSLIARTVVAAAVVLVCGAVLYGVATGLATSLRNRVDRRKALNGIDAAGGAVVGLVAWAAVVWLVAGFVQSSSIYPASEMASASRIVTVLDDIAPMSPATALGALDEALGSAGLPEVFSGTETIPQTAAPDATIPAAVTAESASVVKVEAIQASCSMESSGSGWVEAHGVVVTNAHVVAGASSVQVIGQDDRIYDATVVAFDSQRDVAVLRVPDLQAPVLRQGSSLVAGAPAVVAGYPGGGPYTLGSARVRAELEAAGTDIYQRNAVVRDVYSLRAVVRPGNSGGPLFDDSGEVVGMVFARSTTDADTGYALTLAELQPVLTNAGTTRVATGVCTSE